MANVAFRNIFKSTEPTDVEAAGRRRELAEAMQARALQVPQGDPRNYTGGAALADLASSLVAAWSLKNANKAYQRAKDSQSQATSEALKKYSTSVPDDQVGAEALKRINEAPADELPEPVDSRSQAYGGLVDSLPPEAKQQMIEAIVAQKVSPGKTSSPYGAVQPDKFTPESLAKFEQTGKYSDLTLRSIGPQTGRYNPGDFTPETWAEFVRTGDPSGLQRYVTPQNATVEELEGGKSIVQPDKTGGAPRITKLTTQQQEVDAATNLARAKSEAGAVGEGTGKITADIIKKGNSAANVTDLLDIAEPLIAASTGSTPGAWADSIASFFGKTLTGAEAIAKLKPLAGQLISQMPRMEGPQSDADRLLYQQAAGDVANPKIPTQQRLAAAQTIRQLQERYKDRATAVARPKPTSAPAAPEAGVINFADMK